MKNFVFLNGHWVPATPRLLESLTPGRLRGRGVFETMRCVDGKIFRLKEHLKRLSRGLEILRLPLPCSRRKLHRHLKETVKVNRLRNARVRLVVWQAGRKARLAIVAAALRPDPALRYRRSFRGKLTLFRKRLNSRRPFLKSLDYRPYLRAYEKAIRRGFTEAILINPRGIVMEGSRSNLFFFEDGVLLTPALCCGCLRGVTRQVILRLARKKGIKVREAVLHRERLKKFNEAFLTNAVMGIMPLTHIDGHAFGRGRAGPLTTMLMKDYVWAVRNEIRFR